MNGSPKNISLCYTSVRVRKYSIYQSLYFCLTLYFFHIFIENKYLVFKMSYAHELLCSYTQLPLYFIPIKFRFLSLGSQARDLKRSSQRPYFVLEEIPTDTESLQFGLYYLLRLETTVRCEGRGLSANTSKERKGEVVTKVAMQVTIPTLIWRN